jgi:hypothetical protein
MSNIALLIGLGKGTNNKAREKSLDEKPSRRKTNVN